MSEDHSNKNSRVKAPLPYPDPTDVEKTSALVRTPELDALVANIDNLPTPQLWWLAGYIEGRIGNAPESAARLAPSPAGEQASALPTLTILYGSQTGNAQEMAQVLRDRWQKSQLRVTVHNLGRYKLNRLKTEKQVLILISTHGEGDAPDSSLAFVNSLMADNAPRLNQLSYAVIGLGDVSYKHFCKPARDIDEKLQALGAKAICPRLECDLDYKPAIEQWEDGYLALLNAGSARKDPAPILPLSPDNTEAIVRDEAEIVERVNLCLDEADKKVWHLELQSDLPYQCGDSVAVVVQNTDAIVEKVIACIKKPKDGKTFSVADHSNLTLQVLLQKHMELFRLNRAQVQQFQKLFPNAQLEKIINNESDFDEFVNRENVATLFAYANKPIAAEEAVKILRPITDRLYSISSSPSANPGEIHIALREQFYGLVTPQLAQIEVGQRLPIYIKANPAFRLPNNPDTDLIFIGAGTGVAPYRAFLGERLEQLQQGVKIGRSWLFFGEQSFFNSFLYQLDWQYFINEKVLDQMSVAFSRDQKQKIYLHHRLQENSEQLYQWIKNGATIYVCGDRGRMARDVHNVLEKICADGAQISQQDAQAYLAEMAADGRYQRDIY